jgi:hypothetical protein
MQQPKPKKIRNPRDIKETSFVYSQSQATMASGNGRYPSKIPGKEFRRADSGVKSNIGKKQHFMKANQRSSHISRHQKNRGYEEREEREGPVRDFNDSEGTVDPMMLRDTEYDNMFVWKPAKFESYETLGLTRSKLNPTIRPCGFLPSGKSRMIKNTCLVGRMKKLNLLKKTNPKLAVCITMYNENESELQTTISGVLQNYNSMYLDPEIKMRQEDMVVVLICDGYDNIPESFKEYAREHHFLDEDILLEKGFMELDRDGKLKMKQMSEIVEDHVKDVPKNVLHMF